MTGVRGNRDTSSLEAYYSKPTSQEIGQLMSDYRDAVKKAYEIALQIEDRAFSIPWLTLEITPEMKLKSRYAYCLQKVRLEIRD